MKNAFLSCVTIVLLTLVSASADDRVKVGVLLPLSGDMAVFGKIVQDGIRQANSDGIQLLFEDDGCKPAKSVSAIQKLLHVDGVTYVLGPVCGSPQQAVAPLIRESGAIAMLLGSGTTELFQASGGRIFSPQYSIEDEARFNAARLYEQGVRRAALVFYEDVFCRKHEEAFHRYFKGVVVESLPLSTLDPSALKPIVTRLKSLKIDGIYVPDVSPFLLGLRRQMASIGIGSMRTVSIYSAQLEDVVKTEGAASNGILYSYPAIQDQDAISYFPKLGAQILFDTIRHCKQDVHCAEQHLRQNFPFDEHGVLRGEIELRVIREGRFQRFGVEYTASPDGRP